jgi:hypothetical protein
MDLSRYPGTRAYPPGAFLGVGTMQMKRWVNGPAGPRMSSRAQAVYLPIAYPTFLFGAIGGVMLLFAYRHQRNHRTGCCLVCGYDLRATPDRCPECGTAVGPAA